MVVGGHAEVRGCVLCYKSCLCGDLPSLLCSFPIPLQKLDEGERDLCCLG